MKKQKFLKGKKLVALALVAAMSVTCAEGYRWGVSEAKAAGKAADSLEEIQGATGITGKKVLDLDFGSSYTAGDSETTYTEDGKNFTLGTGTAIVSGTGADGKETKMLHTAAKTCLRSVGEIFTEEDLSKGVAVSVDFKPELQSSDWNALFTIGNNAVAPWVGVMGRNGFMAHAVRIGWCKRYPGGAWQNGQEGAFTWDYFKKQENIDKDVWYKMTYVFTPKKFYIYVDNVLTNMWDVTNDWLDGNPEGPVTSDSVELFKDLASRSSLAIGGNVDPNVDYCNAYYDNFKVYALSSYSITTDNEKVSLKSETDLDSVVHGSDVTFKVTPKTGYKVTAVKVGATPLTGTDGNYTISDVTSDKTVTVTAEAIEYPLKEYTDGVVKNATFTIEDAVDGKVPLTALTEGQIGWFLDADERDTSKAITEFAPADYMTDDGITVYRYNPHEVTEAGDARDGLEDSTSFATLPAGKKYAPGDVVEIKVTPPAGRAPKITTDVPVETTVVTTADGGQAIRFAMPSTAVTITKYEFTGLDITALDAELTTDKTIYDTENTPTASGIETKYTEETWNAFKEAFDAAKAVKDMGTTNNTQAAIDESLAALKKAKADLVYTYKVTLNKASTSIERGTTESLSATLVSDALPLGSATWSSSDEEVATVAGGTVTAVGLGTAAITCTAPDGTKAECKVKVIASVTDITLTDSQMILGAKQKAFFAMGGAVTPIDATELDITWTSSDEAVAAVDAQGNITAKTMGTANITAEVNGHSATASVTVIDHVDSTAGFQSGRSPWMEVGEEGMYLTFKNTTDDDAVHRWDTPNLIVDSGDIVYTVRSDSFVLPAVNGDQSALPVTNLGTGVDWASFLAENKAGTDCYVSAVKVGESIRVRMTIGSYAQETFVPLTGDGPFKVALSGENCDITELQAVDKYHFNDPGPVIPVVPVYPGSVVTPKPVVTPGPEITVPITVENIKVEESLKGTEWWTNSQQGEDYGLSGQNAEMVLYVGASELNGDYGAFSVRIYEGGKFITTGSDLNRETSGGAAVPDLPWGTAVGSNLIKDHVYRITVTRKGKEFTINYYDATDQKDYYEVTIPNTTFGDNVSVHVIAQVGTFDIGQQVTLDGDTPTTAPDVTAGPDVTAAPSAEPSKEPDASAAPSTEPSAEPSTEPSAEPSTEPSAEPDDNKGAETGSKVTVSGSTYKVNSGSQVTYTAKKKASKNVTVPATVKIKGKTYKVTSIAANAFKGNNKIQKVTLSKNITKIGKNAFSNCKKLKTIVIMSKKLKASGIAKNAFKGVTKKTVIKVPKAKKKAYQKLFRKKGLSKKVKVKAI